ncbi:metal ABC transporter ATP-binding protein [Mycobacterium sp. SMC-4]|uniref:metal ABC transporter ATP-binding protein n=1 Tax=Mycobacterium sp. SMC-4 TaxID=2857059 RepID=UPI0021B2B308|nr:metal ABC transporter ATP-binding protein [Mycobacterium sp. SMC-4]UXA17734.1 metal ABC transporter ATP-binding protein [Mycobacterium sp. SMC-4]
MNSPVICLRGVTAGYRGVAAVESIDLDVHAGEMVGLVGPSGSGKSTLLRALIGTADLYSGTVLLNRRAIRRGRPTRDVGFVPQLTSIEPDLPVRAEDAVLLGLAATSSRVPWYSKAERAKARALLERLGLSGCRRTPIGELSGGQQQRLLLGRAMIGDPGLVLLDEPTSGVDLQTLQDILDLLGDLRDRGTTVVLTTHDLNWVAAGLPRVVCINRSVIADGAPTEVLTEDTIEQTYGARVRIVRDGDRVLVTDQPTVPHRSPLDSACTSSPNRSTTGSSSMR